MAAQIVSIKSTGRSWPFRLEFPTAYRPCAKHFKSANFLDAVCFSIKDRDANSRCFSLSLPATEFSPRRRENSEMSYLLIFFLSGIITVIKEIILYCESPINTFGEAMYGCWHLSELRCERRRIKVRWRSRFADVFIVMIIVICCCLLLVELLIIA